MLRPAEQLQINNIQPRQILTEWRHNMVNKQKSQAIRLVMHVLYRLLKNPHYYQFLLCKMVWIFLLIDVDILK